MSKTNETNAAANNATATNQTPAAAPAAPAPAAAGRFTKAMAMAIALTEGGGSPEEIGKRMNELMVAKGQKPIIDPHLDVKYVMAYFVGAGAVQCVDGKLVPFVAEPAAETVTEPAAAAAGK